MNTSQKNDVALYHYDPLDRLTSTHSSQRFYRGTRIATEINGERRTSFFEHESTPLAERHAGDAAILLATDRQTSVLHSINPAQRQPQVYSPYGFRSADNGLLSVMGFNGERPDPVTGHYLLGQGHRAYNPVLMRFNSPDTLSPFGKGGINAYAYCANNPVTRIDPTGKSWITEIFVPFSKHMSDNAPIFPKKYLAKVPAPSISDHYKYLLKMRTISPENPSLAINKTRQYMDEIADQIEMLNVSKNRAQKNLDSYTKFKAEDPNDQYFDRIIDNEKYLLEHKEFEIGKMRDYQQWTLDYFHKITKKQSTTAISEVVNSIRQ